MNAIRRALREEPDRMLTSLLFGVYGVWALIDPPISVTSQTPPLIGTLFNLEFVIISVLLIVGTVKQSYLLRLTGYTMYIIGLLTIAALIAARGSPVFILILAFAVRGYTSIREMRVGNRFIADLRRILKDGASGE